MRILLLTIIFLTTFINYCEGEIEYVLNDIRIETEQTENKEINFDSSGNYYQNGLNIVELNKKIEHDKIIIYLCLTSCTISVLLLALIILLFKKKNKKNRQLQEQRDELKLHTQRLQKQQEELQMLSAVAAATVNAIFITDKEGNFTWFNNSFSKYSGIPFEELHTHPALRGQLMPPEARVAYDKVLKTKKSADFLLNISLFAPSHKDVWMQTTVTPIFDQNNEVSMMILVCSDVTELRETTEKLEESNKELKMLSAVASMTSNSIFITNANGEFIWLNDAFTRDTGITIDQIGKHPALKATAMPPETKRVYEKMLATK
ncbi:MAG: PAS domain S-box protein [Bacteroidales bacterium]|nr:PAS domain S-box protein [Bacteroidales bacterium]